MCVMLLILITSCTTNNIESKQIPTSEELLIESRQKSNNQEIASIVSFDSADEGELIRFYFQIKDTLGNKISTDGKIDLKIFDNLNNLLYEDSFIVYSSKYVDYQFQLTGQSIGKAYEWSISKEDVKKGTSDYGKAEIIFTKNNKQLTASNDFVAIPFFTEEEIKQIYEEDYNKNKKIAEEKIKSLKLEITIKSFGFYKAQSYLDIEEYLRIDLLVKNIDNEPNYFWPSSTVLIDSEGNQYETAYEGTIEGKEMFPNTKQEGYILLEGVPKTLKSANLIFDAGYDEYFETVYLYYQLSI